MKKENKHNITSLLEYASKSQGEKQQTTRNINETAVRLEYGLPHRYNQEMVSYFEHLFIKTFHEFATSNAGGKDMNGDFKTIANDISQLRERVATLEERTKKIEDLPTKSDTESIARKVVTEATANLVTKIDVENLSTKSDVESIVRKIITEATANLATKDYVKEATANLATKSEAESNARKAIKEEDVATKDYVKSQSRKVQVAILVLIIAALYRLFS